MFKSKPLNIKDPEDGWNPFSPPKNPLKKILWHARSFFRRQIVYRLERLKFYWGWYKTLRKVYSFDGHYSYKILNYHLKNVKYSLENGFAIQEKSDMKALDECIKLSERIFEDKYDDKYHEAHDEKWGKLETWFEPCEDSNLQKWCSRRPKAVTKAQMKQEREEFIKTWEDGDKDRQKDINKFYKLLKKHINNWWD